MSFSEFKNRPELALQLFESRNDALTRKITRPIYLIFALILFAPMVQTLRS